jgi:hypothetical protein
MIESIIEGIFSFILECLINIIWWIILFPVVWIVSLPFILIFAFVRREPYHIAVVDMFTSVNNFWREWGLFFTI